jgi:hypothetical protein
MYRTNHALILHPFRAINYSEQYTTFTKIINPEIKNTCSEFTKVKNQTKTASLYFHFESSFIPN